MTTRPSYGRIIRKKSGSSFAAPVTAEPVAKVRQLSSADYEIDVPQSILNAIERNPTVYDALQNLRKAIAESSKKAAGEAEEQAVYAAIRDFNRQRNYHFFAQNQEEDYVAAVGLALIHPIRVPAQTVSR